MRYEWLGLRNYVEAMKIQDRMINRSELIRVMAPVQSAASGFIYGLEHPLTITLGKRANPLYDIKATIKELRARQVAVHGTERGGVATLHNPGQLVIYPIIDLRKRQLKVREYMCLLQDVTKRFLADLGLSVYCKPNQPGVFTVDGKIAFFGIRIKNGIASHGLSINIKNNLQDFQLIKSCGNPLETFAKAEDYVGVPPMDELFLRWCTYFRTGLSLTQDLIRPMVEDQFDVRI